MTKKRLTAWTGRRILTNGLFIAFILAITVATAFTGKVTAEADVPVVYATAYSLLPPIVAIILSLITKEVYSSLFVGIVVGSMLFSNGNAELAFQTMLYHEDAGLVINLTDTSHASVLVFVSLLGTLVVLMNKSGATSAFGQWAETHIKTRIGAELTTILLGLLIFIDDGFNCMTVGSIMRPLTDRHRISRAKLAYLLDATAAPVCIIAPISCWAAAVNSLEVRFWPANLRAASCAALSVTLEGTISRVTRATRYFLAAVVLSVTFTTK